MEDSMFEKDLWGTFEDLSKEEQDEVDLDIEMKPLELGDYYNSMLNSNLDAQNRADKIKYSRDNSLTKKRALTEAVKKQMEVAQKMYVETQRRQEMIQQSVEKEMSPEEFEKKKEFAKLRGQIKMQERRKNKVSDDFFKRETKRQYHYDDDIFFKILDERLNQRNRTEKSEEHGWKKHLRPWIKKIIKTLEKF